MIVYNRITNNLQGLEITVEETFCLNTVAGLNLTAVLAGTTLVPESFLPGSKGTRRSLRALNQFNQHVTIHELYIKCEILG